MAINREDTLRKAEKLLRQGRLDAATAEYERVVQESPRDWATMNTLGDLYVRAGQVDKARAQYRRIAEHFVQEGFFSKAVALYKKTLKIKPDDEAIQLALADLSIKQGLLAEAKTYLLTVERRRRKRGDLRSADEILVRLGSLDPTDLEARKLAVRAVARSGDVTDAAKQFRSLYNDLLERGRDNEALEVLREAARLDPSDRETRKQLARACLARGDVEGARANLDRETAADDPLLLQALAELELRAGRHGEGAEVVRDLLRRSPDLAPDVMQLAWSLAASDRAAAFACVNAVVDGAVKRQEWAEAAAALEEFTARVPQQIPALLRLVEICVDGGLEAVMTEAQAQLTDAYLEAGQAGEARVVAEDLVAREPWEPTHINRFRRALTMLRMPNPDAVIAERLSGQSPFTATDPFADLDSAAAEELKPAQEPTPVVPAQAREPGPAPDKTAVSRPPVQPPAGETPLQDARRQAPGRGRRPQAGGEIDLTHALTELHGVPTGAGPGDSGASGGRQAPASMDDGFGNLRPEAGRQTDEALAEQHLKLARTYREMGMTDEAIAALRLAARSLRHRFEAASLIGRWYREQGQAAQAVEWFERAAEVPAPTLEEGRALLYHLGDTLEGQGETARALAVFLELQADAGDYRDVQARIDRLSRVQTGG